MKIPYYYTDNPNTDFEISEILSHFKIAFIFVPPRIKNLGQLYQQVMTAPNCNACVWSVEKKSDMKVIVEKWIEQTLTQDFWKSIDAKRLFFKVRGDGNIYYDWITRQKIASV